jgi:hypothetical protein
VRRPSEYAVAAKRAAVVRNLRPENGDKGVRELDIKRGALEWLSAAQLR